MLHVLVNRMCTRISFFVLKTVREIRPFFLSMTKVQLKRVNTMKLSRWTIDAYSRKKANFVNRRKLLSRGYKFTNLKKPNVTDLERDLQRPRLRRLMINQRRRTWTPSAGRLGCFFFCCCCFLWLSNNFRFAFLALKVASASQAFTWKIFSAKSNHVLRCSLSRELACGTLIGVLHRSCSWLCCWLSQKGSVLPSAGFVRRLKSRSWKSLFGPAILLNMQIIVTSASLVQLPRSNLG